MIPASISTFTGCADWTALQLLLNDLANFFLPFQYDLYQDTRLLPGYFAPSNIVKDTFWKDESVFFKYSVSSSYFLTFPTLNFFLIFAQKKIRWKHSFDKKYHLRRILEEKIATCSDFEKFQGFFRKNPSIFPKNPKF